MAPSSTGTHDYSWQAGILTGRRWVFKSFLPPGIIVPYLIQGDSTGADRILLQLIPLPTPGWTQDSRLTASVVQDKAQQAVPAFFCEWSFTRKQPSRSCAYRLYPYGSRVAAE